MRAESQCRRVGVTRDAGTLSSCRLSASVGARPGSPPCCRLPAGGPVASPGQHGPSYRKPDAFQGVDRHADQQVSLPHHSRGEVLCMGRLGAGARRSEPRSLSRPPAASPRASLRCRNESFNCDGTSLQSLPDAGRAAAGARTMEARQIEVLPGKGLDKAAICTCVGITSAERTSGSFTPAGRAVREVTDQADCGRPGVLAIETTPGVDYVLAIA